MCPFPVWTVECDTSGSDLEMVKSSDVSNAQQPVDAFVRMVLNNLVGSDVVIVLPVAGSDVAVSHVYCPLRQWSVNKS